jgi:hypothetical protein
MTKSKFIRRLDTMTEKEFDAWYTKQFVYTVENARLYPKYDKQVRKLVYEWDLFRRIIKCGVVSKVMRNWVEADLSLVGQKMREVKESEILWS